MANKWWVGGAGTWDGTTATHWAGVSGGVGGSVTAPTTADDVFFDANSGVGLVTIASSAATARNWNSTGFTGSFGGGGTAGIVGNVTIGAGITAMGFFSMKPAAGTTSTLTTNGKTLNAFDINGAATGTISFADGVTSSATINFISGILATNNNPFQAATFNTSNSNTRTLTMGSSQITITGTGVAWTAQTSTGLTITPNTATITFTGAAANPSLGGGLNYNGTSLVFTGSGITGTNSSAGIFVNFTRTGTAAKGDGHNFLNNQTFTGTVNLNGNSIINRLLIATGTVGLDRIVTAANVVASNVDFMDITAAGAANWNLSAIPGGSGDAGGNTGITFTPSATQIRTGTAGGPWSDGTRWTGRVPLPQDDVILGSGLSSGGNTSGDMPRLGRNIDFTGFLGTFSPTTATSIFGSFAWSPGATSLNSSSAAYTFAGRGTHSITMAGATWGSKPLTFAAPGATYTLADPFTTNSNIILNNGTLVTNDVPVTCSTFTSASGLTRALILGTSTVYLTSVSGTPWNVNSSLTLSAANSNIVIANASTLARTFAGGGLTYGALTYTVPASTGTLTLGSNTYGNLVVSGGHTILMTAGGTATIANFNVGGAAGNLAIIKTTVAGSPATLVKTGEGIVSTDYLSLQDITATPANTWYAGSNSTDVGNNTGWTFADPILWLAKEAADSTVLSITGTALNSVVGMDITASDTSSISLVENIVTFVTIQTFDASVINAVEGGSQLGYTIASDLGVLVLTELAKVHVSATAEELINLSVEDNYALFVRVNADEDLGLDVDDSILLFVPRHGADVSSISLAEMFEFGLVEAVGQDSTTLVIVELDPAGVMASQLAGDETTISLDENIVARGRGFGGDRVTFDTDSATTDSFGTESSTNISFGVESRPVIS